MSIIYDALKKLEKTTGTANGTTLKKDVRKTRIYLLSMCTAFMGVMIAKIFFDFISKGPDKISIIEKSKITIRKNDAIDKIKQDSFTRAPSGIQKKTTMTNTIIANLTGETKKPQGEELVLHGIVFSSETRYALINNRIVKEGAKIKGATVTRITKEWVELKTEDQKTFKLSSD